MTISQFLFLLTLSPLLALAQSETLELSSDLKKEKDSFETSTELQTILVYGRSEIDPSDSTEPTKITKEQIDKQKHDDVMRVLKQVPGVHIREEEGLGLRPNIGIRGTNPDRSRKVVLLEDGVLITPAPYSAPAAYYMPSMNTTSGLEVYKGLAAVPYGPNSVGGSVNYLSKEFSKENSTDLRARFGSFNTLDVRAENTWNFGKKIQLATVVARQQTDGFKELLDNFNTGFEKNDLLFKAKYKINKNHNISLKFGYTDEISNETYLGLTLNEFNQNPLTRYASSENDQMRWDQQRLQITVQNQLNSSSYIKTDIYNNDFSRVWDRLDRFADGTSFNQLFLDPNSTTNSFLLDVLRGVEDSTSLADNLILANNERNFNSRGIQSNYFHATEKNEFQAGVRFHFDEADINHTFDTFSMTNGRLTSAGIRRQTDQQTVGQARAFSATLQNRYNINKSFSVQALGRYESVEFDRVDKENNTSKQRRDEFFVPGVSLSYNHSPSLTFRSSVNQAVNVAGVNILGQADREEATNYEVGLRYQSMKSPMYLEANVFFNDYQNIAGVCTVSSGGCGNADLGTQFNGGEASVFGVESVFGYEHRYRGWQFPIQASVSLMTAEFDNSFTSSSAEWGLGFVEDGARLPYIPRAQYTLNIGAKYRRFSSFLSLSYQSDMVDQSARQNQIVIPAYGVVDLNLDYQIFKAMTIFFKADNLLGREYLVAARPFGLRPGKPQAAFVGFNYRF